MTELLKMMFDLGLDCSMRLYDENQAIAIEFSKEVEGRRRVWTMFIPRVMVEQAKFDVGAMHIQEVRSKFQTEETTT